MSRKTLDERVLALSTQDGDCLIWKGAKSSDKKTPKVWHKGEIVNARVAIWREMGRRVPANATIKAKCGNDLCVAPCCLEPCQYLEYPKAPVLRAKIAKTMQARSRLNMEVCEEIRQSEDPAHELAQRHNVTPETIADIRKYRTWKPLSNPFAGLFGARA